MAETLTAQLQASLTAVLAQSGVLGTPQFNLQLSNLLNIAFATGIDANQANQIYAQTIELAGGASTSINLYNFGGALDPVGNSYIQTGVKLLIVQNLSATEGNTFLIGGDGTGAAWTSPFNSDTNAIVTVNGGGTFLLVDSGATGYPVSSDGTNCVLKINNPSGSTYSFNIIVLGITS